MMTTVDNKKMFIGGKWVEKEHTIEVRDPQDNEVIATVPRANETDMLKAINVAKDGAKTAAEMPVHERMDILHRAADFVKHYKHLYAITIATEGSKTITEAQGEIECCIETLRISAEETRRNHGDTIPFDQIQVHENRVSYLYRFPIDIIGSITMFNDQLTLVAHKIGLAIASSNSIVVKPATLTPLSALLLAEAFEAAGLPENVLSVVTGKGSEIGDALVTHPAVRMISFTGGLETG